MNNLLKLVFLAVVLCLVGVGCGSGEPKSSSVTEAPKEELPAEKVNRADSKAMETERVSSGRASISKTNKMELASGSSVKHEEEKQDEGDAFKKTSAMDWALSPEKREIIEKEIPETKGFIDGNSIVVKIIDAKITGKDERVKLFLEQAKDKYIYLAAQTNPNPFNDNASLNLIFGEGALTPDFMMVQLRNPQNYDHQKYLSLYGGIGYVTAFVGKLAEKNGNLELDPVYDVFLPGYLN